MATDIQTKTDTAIAVGQIITLASLLILILWKVVQERAFRCGGIFSGPFITDVFIANLLLSASVKGF